MNRPATIKSETILDAAREVFLERGIRATTAEIAARAGVSEGSLFNRFKTKQELFWAAFVQSQFEPPWMRMLPGLAGQGDIERTLGDLGVVILAFLERMIPLIMMINASPEHADDLRSKRHNTPPALALKALTAYFEAETRAGRLRPQDPAILARAYLGGLWQHAALSRFVLPADELPMPAETFVRGFVHLLLHGARPAPHDP